MNWVMNPTDSTWWNQTSVPQANVVDALAHFGLNLVDGVTQTLDDGLTSQCFNVEIVSPRREDEESNDRLVRTTDLHLSMN